MKRLLIIVDYQNETVIGSLGFPEAKRIELPICDKIKRYQDRGDAVLFTLDTHFGDILEVKKAKESEDYTLHSGWELYGEVQRYLTPYSMTVSKHSAGSADLYQYLSAEQFDSVELCGVVTNICVLCNAILAKTALPEAQILIDAGCVAGSDPQLHEKALDVMEGLKFVVTGREEKENRDGEI